MRADGTANARLKQALYGCVESAKLWNKDLKGTLISFGWQTNSKDSCVLTRKGVWVSIRVDDLLVCAPNIDEMQELYRELEDQYCDVKMSLDMGSGIDWVCVSGVCRKAYKCGWTSAWHFSGVEPCEISFESDVYAVSGNVPGERGVTDTS